jgi:hypothetical protein
VLVAIVGLLVAGYGVHQIRRGWTVDLDKRLSLTTLAPATRRWVVRVARVGLAARGIVFTVLGYMFVRAAIDADPSATNGVEGVLDAMREHSWLLGIVALGLAAYGIYSMVLARYRRIRAA